MEADVTIYALVVLKGGKAIFSHDVAIEDFANQVALALDRFRRNSPENLLDDDIVITFHKKD